MTENRKNQTDDTLPGQAPELVRFEIYGEEMIEKLVKSSGKSGRIYLPLGWVDHHVKIIRMG